MKSYSLCLKSAVAAGLLASAAVPAFAQEAEDVGERLKDLLAQQQIELTYDAARKEGDDVILEGVAAGSAAEDRTVSLGDLTLQDVSEADGGAYRVGTFALDEFEHQEDDITVSMSGLSITGLLLPADAASDPFAGAMRYDRLEVARVDVSEEGEALGSLENLHADLTEEDGTLRGEGGVESFSLDLAAMAEEGKAVAMLEALGYSQITGSARMDGTWNPADGRTTLTSYEATVEDAGGLHLMVDFAGYTPEFIQGMEEMARQSDSAGQNSSAQGMAMLGMMQQLTFHGLTIRFTDDSLTGKVLEYVAEQQGSTKEDVIAQASATLPAQVGPFLGDALTQSLTEAMRTFLQDPQSLEISAVPQNPVPFAMLMGAAMGAPEMLVQQIGLTIKANQ